ncbi:unnamed protein product, partial [Protopolystoma xenopodis]
APSLSRSPSPVHSPSPSSPLLSASVSPLSNEASTTRNDDSTKHWIPLAFARLQTFLFHLQRDNVHLAARSAQLSTSLAWIVSEIDRLLSLSHTERQDNFSHRLLSSSHHLAIRLADLTGRPESEVSETEAENASLKHRTHSHGSITEIKSKTKTLKVSWIFCII